MDQVEILQERIKKAKDALREAKRKKKERDEKRLMETFRRSGLSLLDLENFIQGAVKK